MKFEFEEKELESVKRIQKDLDAGESIPLFVNSADQEYALKFKCVDVAKANTLIHFLMSKYNNDTLAECGIEVLALEYRNDKNDIIEILEDTIRRLRGH